VGLWDKEDGGIVLSHMRSREVWCWGNEAHRKLTAHFQGNLELRQKPYGNADLVYNKKALQVQEKRLFALLSITVTDSVASNKFKDQCLS
jgi:hypothetical protein